MDSPFRVTPWLLGAAAALLLALGGLWMARGLFLPTGESDGLPSVAGVVPPTDEASIRRFCSLHHALPPPEIFERRVWTKEVDRMYPIAGSPPEGGIGVPPREAALRYYQARAPETLDPPRGQGALGPGGLRFRKKSFTPRGAPPTPAVASVQLVRLTDPRRLDLLFCDMRHGQIALQRLYLPGAPVSVLARVPNPCRAEVVDLDRDGVLDLLVSNLGSFDPYDHQKGSVVWLRGNPAGAFIPLALAEGLGRVSDAQAADLDGDGDLDLAVAVFGWRTGGEVLYLENRTLDWARPAFVPVTLDPRPGAIQTSIADLDRDGRPDIVALISQHFETVEAFFNRGPGRPFEAETVWTAPHPAWGSSGIELVDLEGDGDLDILLANGDTLDSSQLAPWQGVRWLENRGELPFNEKLFAQLPGCHRARSADLDGDGDLDIAASAFLPQFPMEKARLPLGLESVIWLEQTGRGEFARHSLEVHHSDYPALDVGDVDADGDPDIVLGNYALSPEKLWTIEHWITLLENLKKE